MSVTIYQKMLCLNPCFNGRYSLSPEKLIPIQDLQVLILVLMEDTLRDIKDLSSTYICGS